MLSDFCFAIVVKNTRKEINGQGENVSKTISIFRREDELLEYRYRNIFTDEVFAFNKYTTPTTR